MADIKKVLLAYSGGLDTSAIVPWLKENYNCEVICFVADVGQDREDLVGIEEKAKQSGATKCIIKDLREESDADIQGIFQEKTDIDLCKIQIKRIFYEEVIVVYSWNLNPVFSRLFQWKSEPWQ